MILRITIIWIVGGFIIIPYSIYHLLYFAQPDEYALLIVIPLFWIFGFWGVVGPAIAIYRVHTLMKALEQAQSKKELKEAYENNAGKEVIINIVAQENRIPEFITRMFYDKIEKRLKENSPNKSMQPTDKRGG